MAVKKPAMKLCFSITMYMVARNMSSYVCDKLRKGIFCPLVIKCNQLTRIEKADEFNTRNITFLLIA